MNSKKEEEPLLVDLPPIKNKRGKRVEIIAFVSAVCILVLSICLLVVFFIRRSSTPRVDNVAGSTNEIQVAISPLITESSQTAQGTVLQEGQTWQGDGLALTVEEFCILKCGEHIQAKFRLRNSTNQEILVDIFGENFQIVLEDKYLLLERGNVNSADSIIHSEIRNKLIDKGDEIEWQWLFIYRCAGSAGNGILG